MAEEEREGQDVAASAAPGDAAPGGANAPAPKKKRSVKRGWIVGGVIAAVIVVAGAGFWVWHDQPSFCNSICHSPMDTYVETFYSEDPGMLASVHKQAGDNCLSCHEAKITDQVTEAMAWVSDSYPMDADGKYLATGMDFASEEFCVRNGCHTVEDMMEAGRGFAGNDEKFNPHSSHQDMAFECGDCHKAHGKSVLMCNECHRLNLPEGWVSPYDA